MGRNKIEIEYILNQKQRKTCFKKRRLAVVKKAMELSKLSGCQVAVQIYCEEDNSLVNYFSQAENKIPSYKSENVCNYINFSNFDYNELLEIES